MLWTIKIDWRIEAEFCAGEDVSRDYINYANPLFDIFDVQPPSLVFPPQKWIHVLLTELQHPRTGIEIIPPCPCILLEEAAWRSAPWGESFLVGCVARDTIQLLDLHDCLVNYQLQSRLVLFGVCKLWPYAGDKLFMHTVDWIAYSHQNQIFNAKSHSHLLKWCHVAPRGLIDKYKSTILWLVVILSGIEENHTIKYKDKDIDSCQEPRALRVTFRKQIGWKLHPTLFHCGPKFFVWDFWYWVPEFKYTLYRFVTSEVR